MKSDESSFSIVPSNMSSRLSMSTDRTGRRDSISSNASMVYRRLSFEDDLFTARVYKRNYRSPRLQRLLASEHQDYRVTTTSRGDKGKNKNRTADLTAGSFSEVATDVEIFSDPADTNARLPTPEGNTVSTGISILTEKRRPSLERSARSPTPDPYMQLVEACERGDNSRVVELLRFENAEARILLRNTWKLVSESGASGITDRYPGILLHFCPVYEAVSSGQTEVMRTLLKCAESDIDIGQIIEKEIGGRDPGRWRPLHVATKKGHLQMVEFLLEYGAYVNQRTRYGTRAIHLAAGIGSMEILVALIAAGADINCADQDGRQPLHYLTGSRDQPNVIQYLAGKGADIKGVSLLHLACENMFSALNLSS